MKNTLALFVFIHFIISIILGSENNLLTGRVVDLNTNKGISNVNLFILKQKIGTATKEDGSFTLEIISNKKAILLVSHVGYTPRKIHLDGNSKELYIVLQEILFKVEDVVVTGTRTNKLYKNVPIATELITNKEIEDSGAINVKELLLTRSGINTNPSVYGGSELNILGMDSRNILILINGQPITGKFYDRVSLDHIQTSNIDKIEITKGPGSSLYGSDAMGGVINIITNTKTKNDNINLAINYSSPEETIKNNGIKDAAVRYNLSFQKRLKDLLLSINSNLEQLTVDKLIKESDIEDINKFSFNTSIQWKPNQTNRIKLNNRLYHHNEDGNSPLINTFTTIKRNNVNINHSINIKNSWEFNHIFQHQTYSRNYRETWNSGPAAGIIETEDLAAEHLNEYEVIINKKVDLNSISLGMETSNGSYSSNRTGIDKQLVYTNSLFTQYETILFDYYNVVIGLRIDKYSDYKYVYSPRIGLMYSYDERWKFRTSLGKGFRTPSFMERFIDYDHSATFGYKVIGNNDLKAEQSNGITVGIEYFHPNVYQVSLMTYYTEFINHITEYYRGNQEYSYHNINNNYKGLEIRGKWKASSKLSTSWEINFIDNRYSDGSLIPNTQPFSVSNRFSYQFSQYPVGISTNAKWTGPYRASFFDISTGAWVKEGKDRNEYILIDISFDYNFNNFTKIKCGIKNINNYVNPKYGPFIGRSFYFELSTQLIWKD